MYSKTEQELTSKYSSLTSLEIAQKCPHFLKYINYSNATKNKPKELKHALREDDSVCIPICIVLH